MRKQKAQTSSGDEIRSRPVYTPEARQNQLIGLAVDCAEQQLRNGTASAQVITHYLKLATAREQAELELLKKRTELAEAQIKATASYDEIKQLYRDAFDAFRQYSGTAANDEQDFKDI